MTQVDSKSGEVNSTYCRAKGAKDEYVVLSFYKWIQQLGWHEVILQGDSENALMDVLNSVKNMRTSPTQVRRTPKGSKGSLGLAEVMHYSVESQIRTMKLSYERHHPGDGLKPGHALAPWLARHAGWLLVRFQQKTYGRAVY